MECTRLDARRRTVAAGAALLVLAVGAAAHAAVTLQATSTQVSSPGATGQICVMLSTDSEEVAGIQADIRWDGNCATLTSKDNCVRAGSHHKDVHADTEHQPDFTVKVLVLSLGDVDVIPDGPVFCCAFQGEADAGSCCSISLSNAGASSPKGEAIPANVGRPASICTSGSGSQPGRGFNSPSGQGPLSASNAPMPGEGGGAAPPAAAAAAQPGGGRAPAAQVLQGGGAQVPVPPDAALAPPTVPAVQQLPPTPAAAAALATAPAVVLTPRIPQPPLPPPTAAATVAPPQAAAAPAAVHTPATRPTVAAAATKAAAAATKPAAAAKQEAEPPPAKAAEDRGWFGCQIEAGASAGPVIGLALLASLGVIVRRRGK